MLHVHTKLSFGQESVLERDAKLVFRALEAAQECLAGKKVAAPNLPSAGQRWYVADSFGTDENAKHWCDSSSYLENLRAKLVWITGRALELAHVAAVVGKYPAAQHAQAVQGCMERLREDMAGMVARQEAMGRAQEETLKMMGSLASGQHSADGHPPAVSSTERAGAAMAAKWKPLGWSGLNA